MLTTKDFKTAHSLTNSSFLRLSRKVAEQLGKVNEPMTRQVTPTEYEILYPDAFLKAVSERKASQVKEVHAEDVAIIADLVEEVAAIALDLPSRGSVLSLLKSRYIQPENTALNVVDAEVIEVQTRAEILAAMKADLRIKSQTITEEEEALKEIDFIKHQQSLEFAAMQAESQEIERREAQLQAIKRVRSLGKDLSDRTAL